MPSFHRSSRFGFAAGPVTRGLLCATTLTMAMATAMAAKEDKDKDKDPNTEEESKSFLSGNELFPDNSVLKGVTLPSYDANLQLTNTLTAEELTIVTKKNIEAKNVKIDFYGPNRTPQGSISLKKSAFDAPKNLLTTDEPVTFVSDELNVDGSGMAFDTKHSRGFIHGPAKAVSRSKPKPEKAAPKTEPGDKAAPKKETPGEGEAPPKKETAEAVAPPAPEKDPLAGLSPEEKIAKLQLSEERLDQIKADAASRIPQVEEARAKSDASLSANKESAGAAQLAMNKFLQAALLTALMVEEGPAPEGPVPRPVLEPPTEGTETTTITCDGGGFMDNPEGLTIFLKNVKVVNPEFTMTAQKELKVFRRKDPQLAEGKTEEEQREAFKKLATEKQAERAAREAAKKDGTAPPEAKTEGEQANPAPGSEGNAKPDKDKPEKPAPTPEEIQKMIDKKAAMKAGGLGGGDIERIIATGTVLIDYQPKVDEKGQKKDPVKAAAHLVVYDFKKQEILLQGGSPWIVIGTNQPMTVNGDDSYIAVTLKDGRPVYAVTKGGSLSAQFETDSKKEGDKAKPGDKPAGGDKPQGGAKPPGDKPQGGAKPPGGNKPQNGPKPANNGVKPNNR